MATKRPSVRWHNKKLRRNLEGLLSKCYKYGELHGVELGIYIEYEDKKKFVSYESKGFSCDGLIAAKKAQPKSINYLPADIEAKLGMVRPKPDTKKRTKPSTAVSNTKADKCLAPPRRVAITEFPELPAFDLSIMKRGVKGINGSGDISDVE